jgi:hypothetical protein
MHQYNYLQEGIDDGTDDRGTINVDGNHCFCLMKTYGFQKN